MRYVEDNKQRFEVIVIPRDLSKVVLKLAHDDLGPQWICQNLYGSQEKLLLEGSNTRCCVLCEKMYHMQKI